MKSNNRENNAFFNVKQRDHVNKANPPPTFSCWCRNLKSKKTIGAEVTVNSMEQKS